MSNPALRRPRRAVVVPPLLGLLVALTGCASGAGDQESKRLPSDGPSSPPATSAPPSSDPTSATDDPTPTDQSEPQPATTSPPLPPQTSSAPDEPPPLTSEAPAPLPPTSEKPKKSPKFKPTKTPPPSPSGPSVLSGGPTLDGAYPDFNIHVVTRGRSAHCFAYYNTTGVAVDVVRVNVSSRPAGTLVYDRRNADPYCDAMSQFRGIASLAPVCDGRTLPTGSRVEDGACVIRLNVPQPNADADRVAEIRMTLAATCVARTPAPCDRVSPAPTRAQPVRVQWTTAPFFVVACRNLGGEPDFGAAARGVCTLARQSD